mgnify:CR=1 FL=1
MRTCRHWRGVLAGVLVLVLAACIPAVPVAPDESAPIPTPHATLAPEPSPPMIHTLTLGPANAYLIEAPKGLILVDTSLQVFADRIVREI